MGKTLVTGATGFIGSALVAGLAERGDDLRVTVRSDSPLETIEGISAQRVVCDVLDRRAVRRAVKDVDTVFHCAGLVSLRASPELLFRTNVIGTRIVLEEALRAGVSRVVYVSSAMAIGSAEPGSAIDESAVFDRGSCGIPYVNSKHEAEIEALRLAVAGLPVVTVNPTFVLGPGNWGSTSAAMIRTFMQRKLPAYVEGSINVVDVRDVVRGLIFAHERGRIGERYILGGRNFTLDRLFADLGRLTGVEPPVLKLPLQAAMLFAELFERMPGRPPLTRNELLATAQQWSFRSTKARRDLGWRPMPHEEMLEATVECFRERYPEELSGSGRQPLLLRSAGFVGGRLGSLRRDLGL